MNLKSKSMLLSCSLLLGLMLLVGFSSKGEVEQVKPSTMPIKKVALTFDDGPDEKYTNLVLDILEDKEVKATFFVVGKQVELFPETMKRIVEEGHAIGNHSWDHKNFTKISTKQINHQIDKTNNAIKAAVDISTEWVRAPYGAKNKKVKSAISKSGNTEVGWTVDTRDWAGTAKEDMMANVKKNLKPDGIILMHSFGGKGGKLDNTVEFLPELIDYLHEQNYTLVTIPELYNKE